LKKGSSLERLLVTLLGCPIGLVTTSGFGRKRNGAFERAALESCRSRGMDPAGPLRPLSLLGDRAECATSGSHELAVAAATIQFRNVRKSG
jgi:hypothetical protein